MKVNLPAVLRPPAGPRELAEFLLKLDQDDELYNQYFQVSPTTGHVHLFAVYILTFPVMFLLAAFAQNKDWIKKEWI